ncbi:MFS transporter [Virgibacillus sp. 179-BFC.A HS]|uniref:MFS transporter n=1 Tax=Tigheibacillus jepli TaxID=3035914 RepID=A0ABU5CJD5_9BACI|nr:MFS transporter [Virgibacillus sp. 179-BFC.A HS]MDY0406468.1 MFS transporter [Virgibacillus sp. 179-BFC.A HS]
MRSQGKIYFGWYLVATAAIITLLTNGLRLGIGPFEKPILSDLAMSRTEFSMIVAIGMLVYGAGMPIAGWLLKRFNTRSILLAGLVLTCIAVVWTIASKNIISFLLSFGVLLSLGLSFMSPVTMTPIISKWFVRKRGQALFYMTTGAMAGIAVVTPLETVLIHSIGWHYTLLFFGFLFLVLVIPSAVFVMREAPSEGNSETSNQDADKLTKTPHTQPTITWTDALKTKPYWKIVVGLFACGFSMNLLGSHAVPMLTDHHFSPATASFGVGLIGFTAIFSTLALGTVADRYPRKNILGLIYIVRGFGFLGLVFAVTTWQLYIVAIIGGLVWAGSTATASAILGDLYGVQLVGILYGWAYFGHQIGGAVGSFLGDGVMKRLAPILFHSVVPPSCS